ncbi:hypothetical protein AQJ30_15775 [Streptomyces longwoodensis]|uniref:Uncharacterized protein n=1 Tax=Streptomyces longwoodensis TaxID=68231 RepID=A0A101QX43_9ACTN|nr:hypothetical protein [Streptomyces longwoodensis]KUN37741.1 hypothetical protein AQJ30_15775 [Streptomyces longwoodensis]
MDQQYETPEALREFLQMCLTPRPGQERTALRLVELLPPQIAAKAHEFAPHLAGLDRTATDLETQAGQARQAYADALAAWIGGQEPPTTQDRLSSPCFNCTHTLNWHNTAMGGCTIDTCGCDKFRGERYTIGRSGVFATLYDWQEHRLIVEAATVEHCLKIRDQLLAGEPPCVKCGQPKLAHIGWARGHLYAPPEDPAPADTKPMSLIDAATAAYDAAAAHAATCFTCWPGMRFAEMCSAGQAQALAALHQSGVLDCEHIAWDVTTEHPARDGSGWVKSRKCADCGEPMAPITEADPHWPHDGGEPPAGVSEPDTGIVAIRRMVRDMCPTAQRFEPVEVPGTVSPVGWTFATGTGQWTQYGYVMADGAPLAVNLHNTRAAAHDRAREQARQCD